MAQPVVPVGPNTPADPQMQALMEQLASVFKGTGLNFLDKNAMTYLARLLLSGALPGLTQGINFQSSLEPQRERSILALTGGDQSMLDKFSNTAGTNASMAAERSRATGNQADPYDFILQSLMDSNAAGRDWMASGPTRTLGAISEAGNNPLFSMFGDLANMGNNMQIAPKEPSFLGQVLGTVAGGLNWNQMLGMKPPAK